MPEEKQLQLLDALVVRARHSLLAKFVTRVVVDGKRHVEGEQIHQLPEQLPCESMALIRVSGPGQWVSAHTAPVVLLLLEGRVKASLTI
jgi:hypothetical protein